MVYGDSDLVVNQVMKEWDVRSPAMTGYCNVVRKLEKKFEGLELHHIPRIKNQAADDLAKNAFKIVPRPRSGRKCMFTATMWCVTRVRATSISGHGLGRA